MGSGPPLAPGCVGYVPAAPWPRPNGGGAMEIVGGKWPVPASSDVPKEVGPWPQLGDHCGPVGLGDHPWSWRTRPYGPAGHGRGYRWESRAAADFRARDHAHGRGRPPVGGQQASTWMRPGCSGPLEGAADAEGYHLARGGGQAAPRCASLATELRGRLFAARRDEQCHGGTVSGLR